MIDKHIIKAFLKEHSELYEAFKVNYLKEEALKEQAMAQSREEWKAKLDGLKEEYKNYYGLLDQDIIYRLNLPHISLLNFNSLFQQSYVIHLLSTILKDHECVPVTFNEVNHIPSDTDTTYWAYNPTLHHAHWLALLNQLKNHEKAWQWVQTNYHCDAIHLYDSEKFNEEHFHQWFITFFHWVALRSFQS